MILQLFLIVNSISHPQSLFFIQSSRLNCTLLNFQCVMHSNRFVRLSTTVVKFRTGKEPFKSIAGESSSQWCTIKLFQPVKDRIIRDLSDSVESKPAVIKFAGTRS